MSFSSPNFPARQTLRRQKMALFARLRQNLFLKMVSIFSAVVLFVYVRAEHSPNPQTVAQLPAELVVKHLPPGMELDNSDKQISVRVAGPRILVESLKEGDIHAEVDLAAVQATTGKTPPMPLKYTIPSLSQDAMDQVTIIGPNTMRLQVYAYTKRILPVHLVPRTAPAGSHFGWPQITPAEVTCTGREDRVNRVKSLVVQDVPVGDRGINGDFEVVPLDANGDIVADVTRAPDRVHITVPLYSDPPERNVTVSPSITSVPLPPYQIVGITVTPAQIKIVGAQGQDTQPYTLQTEDISLHNATADQDLQVGLVTPPKVSLYDLQGHPINHVRVQIRIAKVVETPAAPPQDPSDSGGEPNSGNTRAGQQTSPRERVESPVHRSEGTPGHG